MNSLFKDLEEEIHQLVSNNDDRSDESLQEDICALQKPKSSRDEISAYYQKIIFSQINETIEELSPIFIHRLEFLRKKLNSDVSDKLQEIIFILEITNEELISQLKFIFSKKYAKEVISNCGLAIILALSNISKYDEKSISSDDGWLCNEFFEKCKNDDFKPFSNIFFKAFGHPFVLNTFPNDPIWRNQELLQSSPYIIKIRKEELSKCLNNIYHFLRRFDNYDMVIYLTFDDNSTRDSLPISSVNCCLNNLSSMLMLEFTSI